MIENNMIFIYDILIVYDIMIFFFKIETNMIYMYDILLNNLMCKIPKLT